MRRRNRYNYNNVNRHNNNILLTEFRFYNKTKKVIKDKILIDIEKKLIASNKTSIYWTSDEFSKHGVGFQLTKEIDDKDGKILPIPNIYIKILEFENAEFTTEQFNTCNTIINKKVFINFELENDQKSILKSFSYEKIKDINKIITLNSWEETLNFLIEKKIIDSYTDDHYYEWTDYNEDIKELFGIENLKEPYYTQNKNGYGRSTIKHIFKVIEKRINDKNYRIELYTNLRSSRQWYIRVISEDDEEYNLIDEDRLYFRSERNDKNYYVDINTNERTDSKEIIDDKEITVNRLIINHQIFDSMAKNIHEILPKNQITITPMIYNFYSERAIKFDDYNIKIDDRQQKINDKYVELIESGRVIKIDKINIGKNIIFIEDERFSLEFPIGFLNVKEKFNKIRDAFRVGDARFNFNKLYENILQLSCLKIINMGRTQYAEYKNFKIMTFHINNMEITVRKDDTRIKINDIFCRIADVYPILCKLICYTDVDEFNKFVKDVSYIGYEWKRMINTGLILELNNPFHNIFKQTGEMDLQSMILRFSLLWDTEKRSNVFLLLNGQKYPIKYKGKFKRFFDYPKRTVTITRLHQELNQCVENLNGDKILEIVENAIEEGKIIQKRGIELVENTIRDISAKEIEINIRGQKMVGYTFNGKISKTQYFINKVDLSVHKMYNGVWDRRCIVDDHTKNRIFEDKLANRLANIYNEPDKLKRYLMVN